MNRITQLTRPQIRNRRRWARALESSVKAKGVLVGTGRAECCLGVACRACDYEQHITRDG